ncbi:MAG TPA: hypothetical protein H9898_09495 [Candidatus Anaerobiospirillum stercoravium]|nr:hypothetical protein [Candidatus Anaerobiospirillum stercoravium]
MTTSKIEAPKRAQQLQHILQRCKEINPEVYETARQMRLVLSLSESSLLTLLLTVVEMGKLIKQLHEMSNTDPLDGASSRLDGPNSMLLRVLMQDLDQTLPVRQEGQLRTFGNVCDATVSEQNIEVMNSLNSFGQLMLNPNLLFTNNKK